METTKKFLAFFCVAIYILATIGGAAYLFYDGHVLFGITNIILSAMALPYFLMMWRRVIK